MIRALVCAWLVASTLASCSKPGEPIVARLEQMTAQVERMPRSAAPWHGARLGDGFVIGSAVRTGAGASAKLRVGKSMLDVRASSVVYFSRTPGQARSDLRVETGSVELEAIDESIGVGHAVIEAGGRARIEAGPDGVTILVRVGRAVLDEDATEVAAGQTITVGPSGAVASPRPDVGVTAKALPEGRVAVSVQGMPARVKTATGERELPVGDHQLEVGATLTVPAGSTLEIARGGGRLVTTGPTELRLGEGPTLAHVASGSVALHGEPGAATASLQGGSVTAGAGAAAAVGVEGKLATIDAQRGETVVHTARGTHALAAGASAVLDAAGVLKPLPAPPRHAVVDIVAGESPTLHDPQAPTPVRITFEQACPQGGVVEVARDRGFKQLLARSGGATSANVLVPAGSFSYRVRCAGGAGASGTLRVARDSGRAPLPRTAARTTVEMDGRDYTILYQNLLPELTLAWRKPTRSASYTFVIKPQRGAELRRPSTAATMRLAAGELREGTYMVWVEPAGGSRSEESRIVLEFDNAAPSVSIDAVEVAAGKVRVKGTVIENSKVSAGGAAVPLDRHRRFDTDLVPRDGDAGLGLRIAHPKSGIHYYVVRTNPT